MTYTNDEVVTSYRQSANKRMQVQILAELQDTSVDEIKRVLRGAGEIVEKKKAGIDDAKARKMHKGCAIDKDIAAALGVTAQAIRSWRRKHKLPINPERKGRMDIKRLRELYDGGLSDAEIASEMERSQSAVSDWRRREGLPPNVKRVGGRIKKDEV